MATTAKPQMTDHDQVPHVLNQYNGQQQEMTFSTQEVQRSLTRARQLLSSLNLDALVLTSMKDLNYCSDLVTSRFGRTYAVVITPEDSVTVTPWVDGGMPWRTTYGENIVYSDWEANNFHRAIQRVLDQRSIKPNRLGIEHDGLTVEE